MDAWIHCNKCYAFPSANGVKPFWFTSCGHIICGDCAGIIEPMNRKTCIICTRESTYMAINRQMPPNLLDMFKQPKVLFQEAIQRVNTSLNFQAYHRDRWLKYQHEKYKKAVERIRSIEQEYGKHTQLERTLREEKQHLLAELAREKERVNYLSSRLNMTAHAHTPNNNMMNHSSTSNSQITATPSDHSDGPIHHRHQGNTSGGSSVFSGGHTRIRLRPIQSVVSNANYTSCSNGNYTSCSNGNYTSRSNHSSNHSANTSFFSSNASFKSRSPAPPLMPGRITKSSVLPPSLGINHHRRRH